MVKRPIERMVRQLYPRNSGSQTASPFVGREDELRHLTASLTLAMEGQGHTILLSGRPGVGKTRLANEALALARERGVTILRGRSFPLQADVAYAPILDAFGPLMRDVGSPHLAVLVEDLPELGRLFGGPLFPRPELLGDPALEKARLFEAVSRLLQRLALEAPIVLFFDDIHWADPATIDLLFHLALNLFDQRALLLVTIDEYLLNSSDNLRAFVVSLQQAGLAEEIVASPLGSDVMSKLVGNILGADAPDDLIAFLNAQAGGLPVFAEALVGALVASGNLVRSSRGKPGWIYVASNRPVVLPSSVRRLVLERLGRLAPSDRRIFDLIAVMGDDAPYTMLKAASGVGEEALIESLGLLRSAGLVSETIEETDVSYCLTEPLIRDIAYHELPEVARRKMQLAAGKLGKLPAEGEQNSLPCGNGAAMANSSLESEMSTVGSQIDSPDDEEESLPWLLERIGEAWEQVGESEPAVAVWREALTERERTGDATAVSRIHRRLALAEWDRGHFESANSHLRASLPSSSRHEPFQELVDLHFTRQHVLSQIGHEAEMADSVEKLISASRRLALGRTEAEANLVSLVYSLGQGDTTVARERALRALNLGEQAQDPAIRRRAHSALTLIGMRLGDHQLIRYNAECGMAVAQRPGVPPMDVILRARLAHASFMAGAWDEALTLNMGAIAAGRKLGHPRYLAYALAGRAMILALRGELAEAEACTAEVRTVFGSRLPEERQVFGLIDIAETALALERGQVERALGIARGFARPPTSWEAAPAGVTAASKPMALALLAEAQIAAGEPDDGLKTASSIARLSPADTPYLMALAHRTEGLAHLAMGQRDEAMSCLVRANREFTALQMPFEAARSLLEQAIAASISQPTAAATAGYSSWAAFERIGARRYADRARRLLRSLGIPPPTSRRIRLTGGPLSARELEVALLVAEGLTSAEIAERLMVSSRTVSTHLDHIYGRLGIGSRTALVRYVIEAGLFPPKDDNT